jgi:hypothetical protein
MKKKAAQIVLCGKCRQAKFEDFEQLAGIDAAMESPSLRKVAEQKLSKRDLLDLLQGARGLLKRTQAGIGDRDEELKKVRNQVRDEISRAIAAEKSLKEKILLQDRYEVTIDTLSALLVAKPKMKEFRMRLDWTNPAGKAESFVAPIDPVGNEQEPL